MSLIGKTFDPDDMPSLPANVRIATDEQRMAWADAETERWRVVATCAICKRELSEGEQVPHRLRHTSNGRVRSAVGTVMQLPTAEDRAEALSVLQELINAS